jgi:hypothetical protein
MFIAVVATLLAAASSPLVLAQEVYDEAHNVTALVGTFSSGSGAVVTGPGFANPANTSFTYPNTTGISYSFTSDGFYEIARYRFVSNGSEPNCITGVMNWVHGTFEFQPNGSLTMDPFGDGYQQIQDPCGAVSNFIQDYNSTELYVNWNIYTDLTKGYKLQLYQFDGSMLAPQYLVANPPNMLPTMKLRNVSGTVANTIETGVNVNDLFAKPTSAAGRTSRTDAALAVGIVGLISAVAASSMLL